MWRFLGQRLAYGLLVLALVLSAISAIIFIAPADPARLTFGQRADVAAIEAKRQQLGLDRPPSVQLLYYWRDLLPLAWVGADARHQYRGWALPLGKGYLMLKRPDLRESYQSGEAVAALLARAIPRTLLLALAAMMLALALGLVLGTVAALYRGRWPDRVAVFASVLGYSLPSYVTAMLLGLWLAYYWGDWTGLRLTGGLVMQNDLGDTVLVWKNLLLPALALGIRPVGIIAQLARSSMLDVLGQDYVRTARAKGLPAWRVYGHHALRNALNPVASASTSWFASLLAGAFFVEKVFNYDGLGLLTINAISTFDVPVVLGAVLFVASAFIGLNILSDLLYAWLDPRVRLGE